MPFLLFELIFAVVGIAFVVVIGFVVRELRRKRQAQAGEPNAAPETAAEPRPARTLGLGRKKAPEPEPEPTEPPAPRRRQLASFVEDAAAEADQVEEPTLPVLPEAPPTHAWPVETSPAVRELAEMPEAPAPDVIELEAPAHLADTEFADIEFVDAEVAGAEGVVPVEAPDFEQAVLARLEKAFDALHDGTITLDAYVARVEDVEAEVEQRIAELSDDTDPTALDAALAARESVRWCLNWAKEHGEQQ